MTAMTTSSDVQLLKLKKLLADAIQYVSGSPPPPVTETTLDDLFQILFSAGGRLYVNPAMAKDKLWSFAVADSRGVPIYFDEKVI